MKKAKLKARVLLPAIGILLLFSLSGCMPQGSGDQAAAQTPAEEVATVFAVNTTPAIQGEINEYFAVNGDVVSKGNIDVYSDAAGKVTRFYVGVGDKVGKGQVIAEVDPSKPGMNFVASKVASPISGTVVSLPVNVGATISQAVPIAKIGRTDALEIRTEISERFISKMKVGLNALVRFTAYPDTVFPAKVTKLSPVVDPQTRTLEVTLQLTKPDTRIKSGMFADVKIITEQKTGIVKVPADALVTRFGANYVFVAKEDGTAERRKVSPGIRIDGKLEITDGLLPDEAVVIRGQTLLEDGVQIRVVERLDMLTADDVIE